MSDEAKMSLDEMLQEAADSVLETCDVQLEMALEHQGPAPDWAERLCYGSHIPFTSSDGPAWNLVFGADEDTALGLTRGLFMMEEDEPCEMEDTVDALGELVNIAGGILRARLMEQVPGLQMGLPLFLDRGCCTEVFAEGVRSAAVRLSDGEGRQVYAGVIWKQGVTS